MISHFMKALCRPAAYVAARAVPSFEAIADPNTAGVPRKSAAVRRIF